MRVRFIVLVLIFFAALLVPGTPIYGGDGAGGRKDVADWTILGLDVPGYNSRTLAKVPLEERRWIRHHKIEVRWRNVQPQAGPFDWSRYDELIGAVLADGSQSIMLVLGGPIPAWARDAAYGEFADKAPPADLGRWRDFCAAAAERYGPVVDFYEVWNEPGWDSDGEAYRLLGTYHFGGQVETDYLPLLQLAYTAIKEKDPSGIVICGSLLDTLADDPDTGTGLYTRLFDDASRPRQEAALTVRADGDIVAARTLRLVCSRDGLLADGLMGIDPGRTRWFFAEGCTRSGCDMWLSLDNRERQEAAVAITYFRGNGTSESRNIRVPARSSLVFPVFDEGLGVGRHDSKLGEVSIAVSSDRPIIAERSLYYRQGGTVKERNGEPDAYSPRREWACEDGSGDYTVKEFLSLLNTGSQAVEAEIVYRFPDGSSENRHVEVAAQSCGRVSVAPGVTGASCAGGASIEVRGSAPLVAELSPRFYCGDSCSGEYTSRGAGEPRTRWDFPAGYNQFSMRDVISLWNGGERPVRAGLDFAMGRGEALHKEVLLQALAGVEVAAGDMLGFNEHCDMVGVHPYRSPGNWGPFYANLVQAMRSIGVEKEVAATEIGWLHHKDDQPDMFSGQGQADAIGDWGIGLLRRAGCRKIWVYKDMDEKPGRSWDKSYFGLFSYDGTPHASWSAYKRWQAENPSYPPLPASMP
ncbi:MAG: hypothetical protein AB1384_04815 [Actinomycetota bacterium]